MTKKHFIALADSIKRHNETMGKDVISSSLQSFTELQINTLADFCQAQSCNFKRDRWIAYIKGECGKHGGKV